MWSPLTFLWIHSTQAASLSGIFMDLDVTQFYLPTLQLSHNFISLEALIMILRFALSNQQQVMH